MRACTGALLSVEFRRARPTESRTLWVLPERWPLVGRSRGWTDPGSRGSTRGPDSLGGVDLEDHPLQRIFPIGMEGLPHVESFEIPGLHVLDESGDELEFGLDQLFLEFGLDHEEPRQSGPARGDEGGA